MKVKIEYVVEVPDEYRAAIRRFYGKPGLATRDEVKRWFENYGSSMDDDLSFVFLVAEERR